ncbi:DDRGK domain-containing protein 1 isoform X2 [Oncorhynchus mykiss]|uniref:DDRGK domain-containing protein 1 isoform X2 n=1 Tax=Oncorhynchus mykiss TaxID=8022 RepID=UPI00187896AD|nr:DDRGK domain-containing protein 1 isoform X2 [Oncorhynchus mykiss]
MDIVVYLIAAAILIVLIVFAVKVRGKTEEADREQRQDVLARVAAPRPQVAEERGAGMPRRRRNLNSRVMAQRRAQRDASDNEDSPVEEVAVEEQEEEEEQQFQATGKLGAKKQRKLEEKQAKRAQREAELAEREERKKMQELREQERSKEDEKERQQEQKEEEEERRAKEEQEKEEEEEYLRLKQSFVVEEQGEADDVTEEEDSKVVLLEDLASHFGMRTQDAIARLQDLLADGELTGVIDDRGKFISITPEELNAVAQFIKQRGRVSISELAQASNSLINLTPEIRNTA